MSALKINPIYLNKQFIEEINEFLQEQSFIELNLFLDENVEKIREKILNLKFEKISNKNEKRSKLIENEIFEFEIIKIIEFFKGIEFLEYIENITQTHLILKKFEINKYEEGDFLKNKNRETDELIEIYFDLSKNLEEHYEGCVYYLSNDEEILQIDPNFNALSIIINDENYSKKINKIKKINKKYIEILKIEIIFEIIEEIL